MKNIFTICLFTILFLLSLQNTFACQCFENFTPLVVHYSKADAVFVGKVTSIKRFGNESEKEAYFPRHRTVEFEIQKIYKGSNSLSERIVLHTNFNAASCGFAKEEAPRKGQQWAVFVYKDKKENRLYFGGMCDLSRLLENPSDISEYENEILPALKDKQGIFGSIADEMKIEGIKNIEVNLEGEGQNLTAQTGERGLFYFPVSSQGTYKITVNVPFPNSYFDASFPVEQTVFRENADENSKILRSVLNYKVQIKEGEFAYNEIKLFVFEPKKLN